MKLPATIVFVLASSAALAEGSSAPWGMGGYEVIDQTVAKYNRSGELFRIEGNCQSACPKFLAIKNVCVERSAALRFHASHDRHGGNIAYWNAQALSHYNARLRTYLVANHYIDTPEFHTIPGSEIIDKFGYRECPRR
jgi:hypothetical protein